MKFRIIASLILVAVIGALYVLSAEGVFTGSSSPPQGGPYGEPLPDQRPLPSDAQPANKFNL